MAELTELESKIGECLGLAQAAQTATTKVEKLVEDADVKGVLQRMRQEAEETEQRTLQVVDQIDGKKTAIKEQARETKQEAAQMLETYLGGEADALDGLEFLIMAEAGELGHWEIVRAMNEKIRDRQFQELVEFAVPVQQRHFETVRERSLMLARAEV